MRSFAFVLVTLLGCRAPAGPFAAEDPCRGPDTRACDDALMAAELRCADEGICPDARAPVPRDACGAAIERAIAEQSAPRVELWAPGDRCRFARASAPRRDGVRWRATPPPRGAAWNCPGRCGPADRAWVEIVDVSDHCARVRVRSGSGGHAWRVCVDNRDRVVVDEIAVW